MSRYKKTFAPRAEKQENQKSSSSQAGNTAYIEITDQDATISLTKNEASQLTYEPFRNHAFKKIENGQSILKFSDDKLAVLALNKALKKLGYTVDEKKLFLSETQNALLAFQYKHNIATSVFLDAITLLKLDEELGALEEKKQETAKQNTTLGNKATFNNSNKEESKSHSKPQNTAVYQATLTKGDPIKLKKCDTNHTNDYCLSVSFIPAKDIPVGDTVTGYAIYYQAVYGGTEEKAIKVAEFWGEKARIDFKKPIAAGTPTTVTVPLEKYLDNLFFGAPKNDQARAALKHKLLGIIEDSIENESKKGLDRNELNDYLTGEYSKITEDENYVALKDKLKNLKAPELSEAGKKAAALLEKDPKNEAAEETLITEFEKFGQKMALYMLQINRKLILTEAERHGIWLPYGEQKNKLQELKTDIEVYRMQMADIQANLPSFQEQQRLQKEAYDAVGRDPFDTYTHDQKVNEATGLEKKHAARNELYRSSPLLSLGDDFNSKGLDSEKEDWAPKWESFNLKSDEQIIAELKNSIIVQLEKINEAEENIREEDPDFIWDLKEIIPISIQQAGLSKNKNAVKAIYDKVRSEATYELIKNIFLIAGGIILSIVSLGQATPFLLAVLAGGGAMAISGYYVQKDIHDYQLNKSLHDASLQFGQVLQGEDPTMVWMALSLLGFLGDTVQVVRILSAARATNTVYRTIITLSKQKGLTAAEELLLEEMVSNAKKINQLYTSEEIIQLASTADRLGMSSTELVHLMFIGGRAEKPLSATELMRQMKTWKQVVKPRGYSFRFSSRQQFEDFSKYLIENLKVTEVPVYDIRVQGSALRSPNAKDVDLVSMVTKEDFADCLIKSFDGKIKYKESGSVIDISGKSYEELQKIAKKIFEQQDLYNATSRTFMNAALEGKISSKSASSIKTPFLNSFREARVKVAERYPFLNVEDMVIQPIGGNFDLEPYFKLSETGIQTFDIIDLVPLVKSGKFVEQIDKQNEK